MSEEDDTNYESLLTRGLFCQHQLKHKISGRKNRGSRGLSVSIYPPHRNKVFFDVLHTSFEIFPNSGTIHLTPLGVPEMMYSVYRESRGVRATPKPLELSPWKLDLTEH
jgi:hypothetical protein